METQLVFRGEQYLGHRSAMKGYRVFLLTMLVALISSLFTERVIPRTSVNQEIRPGCGAIEGHVLDDSGAPVSGVMVFSLTMDRPPRARTLDVSAISGTDGAFFLGCVEPWMNG